MSIVFDMIIALLCCVGIVAIICIALIPRRTRNAYVAGIVASDDLTRAINWITPLKLIAGRVIIVGHFGDVAQDIESLYRNVTVIEPEKLGEYLGSVSGEVYGQGADKN